MKTYPFSLEAEQWVLGALLQEPAQLNEIIGVLPSEAMFLDPRHRGIYTALLEFQKTDQFPDFVTLAQKVRNVPIEYMAELVDTTPTTAMLKSHANIVRNKAILREIVQQADALIMSATEAADPSEIPETVRTGLFRALEGNTPKDFQTLGQSVMSALRQSEAREKGEIQPLMTGYPKLDEIMGGLWPGDLTLLAARTSKGKSSLAINIADNMTLKDEELVCLYFAMELTNEDVASRILSHNSQISAGAIRGGNIGYREGQWEKAGRTAVELNKRKLVICDAPAQSIQGLRSMCHKVKTKYGRLDIIFVDHAGLMIAPGSKRHEQLEYITRGLKALAKDLRIPVFAVAQINRESAKKANSTPELHEIKGSGSYEEDAQQVLLLTKDFTGSDIDPAQVRVEKNTHGACGKVEFFFSPQFTRFEEA